VFDRGEDAPSTTVTVVEVPVAAPAAARPQPSSRRDGLAIAFWCEGCHGEFELTLAQHMGNTEISWRDKLPAILKPAPAKPTRDISDLFA
jgi:hypothetical protein